MRVKSANPRLCRQIEGSKMNFWKDYYTKKPELPLPHPGYAQELLFYPVTNPILITPEWIIVNYFRMLDGVCLFCTFHKEYDFSCLMEREIWLLYLKKSDFSLAVESGQKIQQVGASKVFIILFDSTLLGVGDES